MIDAPRDIASNQQALIEAQHRVRNILAVVRSLVRRTAQSAETVEDFEQHLDGRLATVARVHTYLLRDPGAGMSLEMIVRDELLVHLAGDSASIAITGPEIRLSARIAESFSLAVHELITNAIKYGALAHAEGRISISWTIDHDGMKPMLAFLWEECLLDTCLPSPSRCGFGTELLDQVMRYELDAEPVFAFRPDGMRYSVRLPL